jgi:hypothetical protein
MADHSNVLNFDILPNFDQFRKGLKEIEDQGFNLGIGAKTLKELSSMSDAFKKRLGDAASSGIKSGFGASWTKEVDKAGQKLNQVLTGAVKRAGDLEAKFLKAKEQTEKLMAGRRLADLSAEEKKKKAILQIEMKGIQQQQKELLKATQAEARQHKGHFEEQMQRQNQVAEKRMQHYRQFSEFMKKDLGNQVESFAQGLVDAFDNLKSMNFAAIGKQMAGLMQGGGKALEKKGEEKGGKMGKMMGGLGKSMTKLGAALGVIAGIAAGIGMLIKVLIDADNQFKEFNKTVQNSGGMLGMMNVQGKNLEANLRTLQKALAGSPGFLNNLAITAKDAYGALASFEQAGYTFQEIAGGAKDATEQIRRYQDAVETASNLSKVFGESIDSIAGNMAEYMEKLGMSLEDVRDRFSDVASKAQQSGFGTKRFYGMVLQATSGMSQYNTRIEETAGLLLRLGKVLGAKVGAEFLQGLGGLKDEGVMDRFKRVKTTGAKTFKKINKFETQAQSADIISIAKRGKMMDPDVWATKLQGVFGPQFDAQSPEALAKAMAKATGKQRRELFAAMREAKGGEEMVRKLDELALVAKGTYGKVDSNDLVRAMEGYGQKAEMLAKMKTGAGLMGGRKLFEIDESMVSKALLENLGLSAKEFRQYSRIQEEGYSAFERMNTIAKDAKSGKEGSFGAQLRGPDGKAKTEDEQLALQRAQIKAHGAAVLMDEKGNTKIVKAQIDASGNITAGIEDLSGDFEEFFLKRDTGMNTPGETYDEMTIATQEIAANTLDFGTIIENGVTYWLQQISDTTGNILGFLFGPTKKLSAEARKDKRKVTKELRKQEKIAHSKDKIQQKRIKEIDHTIKSGKIKDKTTGKKRDVTAQEMEDLKAERMEKTQARVLNKARIGQLRGKQEALQNFHEFKDADSAEAMNSMTSEKRRAIFHGVAGEGKGGGPLGMGAALMGDFNAMAREDHTMWLDAGKGSLASQGSVMSEMGLDGPNTWGQAFKSMVPFMPSAQNYRNENKNLIGGARLATVNESGRNAPERLLNLTTKDAKVGARDASGFVRNTPGSSLEGEPMLQPGAEGRTGMRHTWKGDRRVFSSPEQQGVIAKRERAAALSTTSGEVAQRVLKTDNDGKWRSDYYTETIDPMKQNYKQMLSPSYYNEKGDLGGGQRFLQTEGMSGGFNKLFGKDGGNAGNARPLKVGTTQEQMMSIMTSPEFMDRMKLDQFMVAKSKLMETNEKGQVVGKAGQAAHREAATYSTEEAKGKTGQALIQAKEAAYEHKINEIAAQMVMDPEAAKKRGGKEGEDGPYAADVKVVADYRKAVFKAANKYYTDSLAYDKKNQAIIDKTRQNTTTANTYLKDIVDYNIAQTKAELQSFAKEGEKGHITEKQAAALAEKIAGGSLKPGDVEFLRKKAEESGSQSNVGRWFNKNIQDPKTAGNPEADCNARKAKGEKVKWDGGNCVAVAEDYAAILQDGAMHMRDGYALYPPNGGMPVSFERGDLIIAAKGSASLPGLGGGGSGGGMTVNIQIDATEGREKYIGERVVAALKTYNKMTMGA